MDFGIAETGIARGSLPGTTTEVLRFGDPFAEIRVVSLQVWFDLVRFHLAGSRNGWMTTSDVITDGLL
jgi:hypothetical protein